MDYLPDSTNSGAEGTLKRVGGGALLAVAIVLVLAASSAGLLAAGAFLVSGA